MIIRAEVLHRDDTGGSPGRRSGASEPAMAGWAEGADRCGDAGAGRDGEQRGAATRRSCEPCVVVADDGPEGTACSAGAGGRG